MSNVEVTLSLRVSHRVTNATIIDHHSWKGAVQPEPYLAGDRLLLEIRAESLALLKAVRDLRTHLAVSSDDWKVTVLHSEFKLKKE